MRESTSKDAGGPESAATVGARVPVPAWSAQARVCPSGFRAAQPHDKLGGSGRESKMAQWYHLGCLDCRLFVDLHKFLPADAWYERFYEAAL